MNINLKKFIFPLLLSSSVLLSACGNNDEPTNQDDGASSTSDEVKYLEMWTRESSQYNVELAVEAFNSSRDDVQVELRAFPNENFTDQFMSALSADTGPDILSLDIVFTPYFASIGALENITDLYEDLDYGDEFIDSMIASSEFENEYYALPFTADVSALFYNRAHFEEVGLDPDSPPETWDDLREYSQALTVDGRYGYSYAGADIGGTVFTFLPFLWGNGGAVLNEDGTESIINSTESIEALELYDELTNELQVTPQGAPTYSWAQNEDAFTSGLVSMFSSGNFLPLIMDDYPDIDWDVTLIPRNEGKEHSSFAGGEVISIPVSSEYPDEAKDFIDFVLSEEVQIEIFAKNGTVPVRADFFDNEYFQEDPRYLVFTEALEVSSATVSPQYNEIFTAPVMGNIQRALQGEITPQQAFENAEEEINTILD